MDIKLHAQTEDEENSMLNFLMNESQFQRNENSAVAEKWNKCRRDVLQICVDELLIPTFAREAHEILLDEAKEFVVKVCFLLPSIFFSLS